MARAAVDALGARGVTPAGGLIVAHHAARAPAPALDVAVGDHPVPGERSGRASDAVAAAAARVGPLDLAVVLLSGGASSLVGAPVAPARLSAGDIAETARVLLAAGVPIDLVNALRKRTSRWGAGGLARALAPARVLCLAVSDVPGDDPAVIGSGPCSPDPWTAASLRELFIARSLWTPLPGAVRALLDLQAGQRVPDIRSETPKPGDPMFDGVRVQVVRTNADARRAAADALRETGIAVIEHDGWLAGEAADLGRTLVASILAGPPHAAHVWGGEPTVTLGGPDQPHARGGRMQELALAAAAALDHMGPLGRPITLLAAGTDGRDGPTDAAGAVVDARTWTAIRAAGREPSADLASHHSYDALGAAGALLPAAPTGTNVADVIVALRRGM